MEHIKHDNIECGMECIKHGRNTGVRGKLFAAAAAVLLLGIFAGSREIRAGAGSQNESGITGTISIVGSTSMERLVDTLAECFMEKYPDVAVSVQFAGSSAGIRAVMEGDADIGISSRELKPEEEAEGIRGNIVALDGIAVCVDTSNQINGLTQQQLIDIYTGRFTNWSVLGGQDRPIVVIGREAGSGTRCAFEGLLGIEGVCTYANELDSTGAVTARIASTPGAIGYVSFDIITQDIKALSLGGIEPSAGNIKTGNYHLCRPFIMALKGEISVQSEPVQKWFEFVYSKEGQKIAESLGYIPAD